MTTVLKTEGLRIDSDLLTQWKSEYAEILRATKKKLTETVLLCEDGSLMLMASNAEVQIAIKVEAGRWSQEQDV